MVRGEVMRGGVRGEVVRGGVRGEGWRSATIVPYLYGMVGVVDRGLAVVLPELCHVELRLVGGPGRVQVLE